MRSPSAGSVEDSSSARFQPSRRSNPPDGIPPVEGLRMRQVFAHEPVMVEEVVALFAPVPAGVVIDATAGGGGHADALLSAHPDLRLLCLDRDPDAVTATTTRLAPYGARAVVRRARFDHLGEVAADLGIETGSVSGVLFDLGVSSPQLDRPERGFSYRADAPLDMRMDPDVGPTASDVVNTMPEADLARLFAANGEGRFARRIARAVVAARPISTTGALADVVRSALPAAVRRQGGHPARRVFQAVRVAVNDELDVLAASLPIAIDALAPGGRCVVIAYHSGEDRIVKAAFRLAETGGCTCPPGLPCICGAQSFGKLVFRGTRRPTQAETARNRRAESALMRAFERGAA
jgi:16S rRNA (cytosine1402-N4)-methyltransferase